jgi:hypothetical protein
VAHLAKAANGNRLRHRKNAAYAWRQTVFFLSLMPSEKVIQFIDDNRSLAGLAGAAKEHGAVMFQGLIAAATGTGPMPAPFLGWAT